MSPWVFPFISGLPKRVVLWTLSFRRQPYERPSLGGSFSRIQAVFRLCMWAFCFRNAQIQRGNFGVFPKISPFRTPCCNITRGPPWGGRFPGFRLFSAFRGRRFQVPFTLGHPYHKDWRPESRQPLHGRHPLRVGTPRSTAQKNCPVGLSWTPGVYSASHRKFCPQGYISIKSAKPGAFFFSKKRPSPGTVDSIEICP